MGLKAFFNNFFKKIHQFFASLLIVAAAIFTVIVIGGVCLNIVKSKTTFFVYLTFALGVFGYIWYRRRKVAKSNSSSGYLFFGIVKLAVVIVVFFFVIQGFFNPNHFQPLQFEEDETVTLHTDSINGSVEQYYLSQQDWKDFNRQRHSLPFKISYNNVVASNQNRTGYKITRKFSWGDFYKHVSDNDQPLIEELAKTFYAYQQKEQMSRRDFAELIISAIQDIPYNLILGRVCTDKDMKPCYGNIKFGVFAPAEFIASLRGDCDTRTILLFTLLSRFNYDIAILNSEVYKHSVLGIHIPATGKYKTIHNKKYYFVETTARGCPIGYLASDVSDIKKWKFVLLHHKNS
ncbi:hypothetical protein MHTCC0001_12500 [Flavobacteriaceae bacterium MHTCC 0001]